jgi:uncharacterized membrane protein
MYFYPLLLAYCLCVATPSYWRTVYVLLLPPTGVLFMCCYSLLLAYCLCISTPSYWRTVHVLLLPPIGVLFMCYYSLLLAYCLCISTPSYWLTLYMLLLPPTGVLFATAIAVIKCNIGFFSISAVGTELTVKVTLRRSYAYNSSGQASLEVLLGC